MDIMRADKRKKMGRLLSEVYGPEQGGQLVEDILGLMEELRAEKTRNNRLERSNRLNLSRAGAALITYANSIEDGDGKAPLAVMREFVRRYDLAKVLPIVHLLPFYPWDTDRGFSVMDYRAVDENNGSWEDIDKLGQEVKLMFDFAANHASIDNPLIQKALIARHLSEDDDRYAEAADYKDFVLAYTDEDKPGEADLAKLTRPRAHPVLTRYKIVENNNGELKAELGAVDAGQAELGDGWVWTTFSRPPAEDGSETTRQVDLNYLNPMVFLEALKIIFFYVEKGADLIRMDAIAYIWKKLGSSSIHERETHILLAAVDLILGEAAPRTTTIAEVNEPENMYLTYLGNDNDPEADMAYQFVSFPLAIHAVAYGRAGYYQQWLISTNRFKGRQFTTVLGSHDGMGLKPVRDILSGQEIEEMSNLLVEDYGALPNYSQLPGGKKIIYELCATPWNLINRPDSREAEKLQIDRYMAVLSLGLLVKGIPGIYINGLVGAENYQPAEGLDENRTVNREIFRAGELFAILDGNSRQRKVLEAIKKRLSIRAKQPAWLAKAGSIKEWGDGYDHSVCARVEGDDADQVVWTATNVTDKEQELVLPVEQEKLVDLISGKECAVTDGEIKIDLRPYQVGWFIRSR